MTSSTFATQISPFVQKYLGYAGWTPDRFIDPAPIAEKLKKYYWQGEFPQIWYEIVSSIEALESFTIPYGSIPEYGSEESKAEGFRAYDLFFSADEGTNIPWVSEELSKHFGVNFGPLGIHNQLGIWLVDDNCRFYSYWEGHVEIFGTGLEEGLDSLFRAEPIDRLKLPLCDIDAWVDRFPEPESLLKVQGV